MKLRRRPGTFTSFIDSSTQETLLKIESDPQGTSLVSYHLYDSTGGLVIDSDGPQVFLGGGEFRGRDQELLLLLPSEPDGHVQYRLYSCRGVLITCSDGARTQIFGGVRIEGNRALGRQAAVE